jgi:hypothetical protein
MVRWKVISECSTIFFWFLHVGNSATSRKNWLCFISYEKKYQNSEKNMVRWKATSDRPPFDHFLVFAYVLKNAYVLSVIRKRTQSRQKKFIFLFTKIKFFLIIVIDSVLLHLLLEFVFQKIVALLENNLITTIVRELLVGQHHRVEQLNRVE